MFKEVQIDVTMPMVTEGFMNEIIENSFLAFKTWRKLSLNDRAALLQTIGVLLERNKEIFATLMAHEMGKPLREGRAEIEKCVWACSYFAKDGPQMLKDEQRESTLNTTFVRYEPLGPILAIMPWNYPFWQVFRMAAPAILAGNTILLKHSLITPRCASAIANVFFEAGFENLLQNLNATHEQIPPIIADPRIRAVTLTGSTRAGKTLAELAGYYLKKVVLELGGSDPFIILEDVDVPKVAQNAAKARCQNSGQSCIASKRFIVHESIIAAFLKNFVEAMQSLVMGDPFKENTDIGPLASKEQQLLVDSQVQDAVSKGAQLLCGGVLPHGIDSYYPPTVLTKLNPLMRVYSEEVFGPVACVFSFNNIDEALKLANDTAFGLSSSIWTTDESQALNLVNDLEFGSVFINAMPRSDPRLPFGGVKDSGFGRELGKEGLMEFVNQKVISIANF